MHKRLMGFGLLLGLWLTMVPAVAAPNASTASPASTDGGDAGAPVATAVELTVLPGRPRYGERVQVRARVTAPEARRLRRPTFNSAEVPTGSVRFVVNEVGGKVETRAALDAAGYASMTFVPSSTKVNEIAAHYDGDATHGPSTWSVPLYIDKAPSSTLLTSSANPAKVGTLRLTATVAPASSAPRLPSGKVHFASGGAEVAAIDLDAHGQAVFDATSYPVGAYTFAVTYAGDENFIEGAPPSSLAQKIDLYATTVKVDVSPKSAVYGDRITFSVAVTGADGRFPKAPAFLTLWDDINGVHDWQRNRTLVLDASGKASYTTSADERLEGGMHDIDVQFHGDAKYAYASGATSLVVAKAPTTTSLTGSGSTLSAHVAATVRGKFTGSVQFLEGAVRVGGQYLGEYDRDANVTLTGLAPGAHQIVAVYEGNRDFDASRSEPITVQIATTPPPSGGGGRPDAGGGYPPPPLLPPYDAGYDPFPDYNPDYDGYDDTSDYDGRGCAIAGRSGSQGGALLGALALAWTVLVVFARRARASSRR